tara:strand:- start:245 stop:790 length:546 start_codon:yes stop_codon:yes gene_type:complete
MNNKLSISTFEVFTHEQVVKINEEIKKNVLRTQQLSDGAQNVSKIGKFSIVRCGPLMELIHPWLYLCQESNKKLFGYDIEWDFHLDTLSYNVYDTDGEYGWHVDATDKNKIVRDTKLTCLLNLSEKQYEGGEFHVISHEGEQKFSSGMGIVFTSLLAHKVTPVTKGERITLTYWASGTAWR